jgi:uncharacterized protein
MIAPLVIGFAFGWILQRSGLSRYDRIANVFRFRDLTVMRFLMSALVTAAMGTAILRGYGDAPVPVPATYALGNVVGGIVFGVGMALSGFCPGTIAAGAGEGRLDYLVPGALGLLAGAVVYGLGYERVMPILARGAREWTLSEVLGVSAPVALVLVVESVLLALYLMRAHRARGWHERSLDPGRNQEGGRS